VAEALEHSRGVFTGVEAVPQPALYPCIETIEGDRAEGRAFEQVDIEADARSDTFNGIVEVDGRSAARRSEEEDAFGRVDDDTARTRGIEDDTVNPGSAMCRRNVARRCRHKIEEDDVVAGAAVGGRKPTTLGVEGVVSAAAIENVVTAAAVEAVVAGIAGQRIVECGSVHEIEIGELVHP